MVTNYFTLRALVAEWRSRLTGSTVADGFSQTKDELSLTFATAGDERTLRVGTRAPSQYAFTAEGHHRARRNVATLFEEALGHTVENIRIAERDRIIYVELSGSLLIQILLFGPKANVLLVREDGLISEAFQRGAALEGTPAPLPRPAPGVNTVAELAGRWDTKGKSLEQAVSRAFPLFDRTLAAEVLYRARITEESALEVTDADLQKLYDAALSVEDELNHPAPRVYWHDADPTAFSLVGLRAFAHLKEERFDTVDAAVALFVRRTLARQSFQQVHAPLERALAAAAEHNRASAERMLDELSTESRAERYERWGHLLMASAAGEPSGSSTVTVADLYGSGSGTATIPLDPALTAIENAQRYYDRARRTRQARAHAEERLVATEASAREAEMLLEQVRSLTTVKQIDSYKQNHGPRLQRFLSGGPAGTESLPFRRYALENGYEVWVGKNAQQNDALTFHHAQKYDLWMHARGVPGSHAVLRLPNRQAQPGRPLLEQAASIAAYHSKARGSGLVPVIVAERKYVRKPKGAPPGAVKVEREEVLIVEPRLPDK